MKIYAFEISAGKKVDMLPECQALIEEVSASHSTDLQQRAYELQGVLGLDDHAVENIMPSDASCEDIEIDKSLSFLNSYVQQSLGKGAQPYIPEHERCGMLNANNFRNQDQHEASAHGLRFEAYELPKSTASSRISSVSQASSNELVRVPEPSYSKEVHQSASLSSMQDAEQSELRLRLDGVQKKWGQPTYSSPATSASNSSSQKTVHGGVTQVDVTSTLNSKARQTSYDTKRQQVEIPPEKQKLAASLFGGTKSEKRPTSTTHKTAKAGIHPPEKSHVGKAVRSTETPSAKLALEPPPDLLDLDGPSVTDVTPSVDPFKQLEGLIDSSQVNSTANSDGVYAPKAPDVMSLYASGQSSSFANPLPTTKEDSSLISGLSSATGQTAHGGTTLRQQTQPSKGPSPKVDLERDALVRQMGVNPSSQNPNLFRDLLG